MEGKQAGKIRKALVGLEKSEWNPGPKQNVDRKVKQG